MGSQTHGIHFKPAVSVDFVSVPEGSHGWSEVLTSEEICHVVRQTRADGLGTQQQQKHGMFQPNPDEKWNVLGLCRFTSHVFVCESHLVMIRQPGNCAGDVSVIGTDVHARSVANLVVVAVVVQVRVWGDVSNSRSYWLKLLLQLVNSNTRLVNSHAFPLWAHLSLGLRPAYFFVVGQS